MPKDGNDTKIVQLDTPRLKTASPFSLQGWLVGTRLKR